MTATNQDPRNQRIWDAKPSCTLPPTMVKRNTEYHYTGILLLNINLFIPTKKQVSPL